MEVVSTPLYLRLTSRNLFDITDGDQKLFSDFADFVKNFNDYISKEWDDKVQSRQGEVTPEEMKPVEGFVDIDIDEDKK